MGEIGKDESVGCGSKLTSPSFMTNGKISQDNNRVGDNPGDKVFNRSSSVSSCSGSQNCTLLLLFEAS